MLLGCQARCVFRGSGVAASGQTGLMAVRTVGHGTLTRAAFVDLLTGAGIAAVVDVRRHPGSRRHPHFNVDDMRRWLPAAGVAYRWDERLGGRRLPDSPNRGLRNAGFQGYADHSCAAPLPIAAYLVRDAAGVPAGATERASLAAVRSRSGRWCRVRRPVSAVLGGRLTNLGKAPLRHLEDGQDLDEEGRSRTGDVLERRLVA